MSLLRPRRHARHAKPSKAAPVLLAGGMTAAFAVADGVAFSSLASAGGSQAQFERLAQCESGGNWGINTGNGYSGGLQFNLATWRGVGFSGYPHQASKATQIQAGQRLHSQRGWSPWPACSRKLGLSGNGGVTGESAPAQEQAAAPAPTPTVSAASDRRASAAKASRSRTRQAAVTTTGVPAFSGQVLSAADVRTYSPLVRTWQARMRARGWRISADGHFGPQSAGVASRFAAQKGLSATPGTVNAAVWAAAWTAPLR